MTWIPSDFAQWRRATATFRAEAAVGPPTRWTKREWKSRRSRAVREAG